MKTQITMTALKEPKEATVTMPGSKSYTNRALIMAALTQGPVSLIHPLYSDDTNAMIECLRILGIDIETLENEIIVHTDISAVEDKNYTLFAYDSGTTVRFMLALLCLVPGIKTIQGSSRLNDRPIQDLVEALQQIGAVITYCDKQGQLPVTVYSSSLSGPSVYLKGDISSQFCSALLLIAPYLSNGLLIQNTGALISKPYIDMTISCMKEAGVEVQTEEDKNYRIAKGQSYQQTKYTIEGDFSSAGYFFAIAALTQSRILVENLSASSLQADRKLLPILAQMGNTIIYQDTGVCVQGKQILPLDIDMESCPDQVMTMAVLAAFAKGVTTISGVRSLRVKETERVIALQASLGKMGIKTDATHDTLTIYGGSPRAATIDSYNDHRIAMAFAVAGMYLPGMVILDPNVVHKTFPTFWEVVRSLQ
ncbi:MAG: 3-phosphoshikimate 1-carboxyvinyltransferase [Chlamydiia bacterium]